MIKIKQLGNGGAFDYKSTNSSFLIDTGKDSYFLFDCGTNVFAELRKQHDEGEIDLSKLKYVYISHMDDDHVGSLKSLIYYMYYAFGKRLQVISVGNEDRRLDVYGPLCSYTDDIDGFVENDEKIIDDLFNMIPIGFKQTFKVDGFSITPLETKHFKACYGLIFKLTPNIQHDQIGDPKGDKIFLISGDTRANAAARDQLDKTAVKFAFHDFSNWDVPGSQTHCCATDFNSKYKLIKDKIIKYHDNGDFDGGWREFDAIAKMISKKIHDAKEKNAKGN